MRALTIVHVVFSSRIAGGEHHCVDLANAQAALGHRVHVIGRAGSAIEGVLNDNVPFHGLKTALLRGLRVRHLARQLGADVVHGHLGPACKATAWVTGAARLGTLHVGFKPHQHGRLDGLVCVNARQESTLSDYDGLRRVVYNWPPERDPASTRATRTLREEIGVPPGTPVIGCVGRLHKAKGMDLLLAAFLQHAPANAHLVLLGEGPVRAELEAMREGDPRVHLLGFRWDVDQLLSQMDVCVSPSREEAFPLAILEAMRAGLPIVATATDGAREMLQDQEATLVPLNDIDAIGLAVNQALLACAEGRRRVAYRLDRFDRSNAVKSTLSLYQEVMARRAAMAPSGVDFMAEDARA